MAFTTGTTMFNSNVLNIIDLQTNVDSAGGSVVGAVTSLQTIIDPALAQISVDTIQSFTNGGNININAPLYISDNTGLTTFSNTNADPYSLYVYGNIYASNYNSLCPLRFTVEGFEAMTIREDGTLIVAGPAIFNGPVEFRGDVTIAGTLKVGSISTIT
jgi:hypothetical protein